ncbi:MAG TPA: phosphotransferase [Solirubrobacterales bacterium]|nr:phosphotransferase [Solirubrobacterales bacterium]
MAELGADLEMAVRRVAGSRAEIAGVHRAPNPYASVSPSEVVSVELATGERVAIFVKHLGEEQRSHPDKRLREREVRVYGELLGDRDLPVARFLGSGRDKATGRRRLFLEYVDGWSLKYRDLNHWYTAARRLAHLHLAFAREADRLLERDFLLRLDSDYVLAWAGRALAAVSSLSAEQASRLRRTVDDLEVVAELLAAQPPTLVHNDLAPKNVIAATSAIPGRTCIVDWEMAGVGCGLLDLTHLMYGLPPREVGRMLDLYRRELAGTGLMPSGEEGKRLLAACRLHGALYRLAHADVWGLPLERVGEWIAESEELDREVAR